MAAWAVPKDVQIHKYIFKRRVMYAPERGFLWGRKYLQLHLSPWAQMDKCHYLLVGQVVVQWCSAGNKPQTFVVQWAGITVLRGWWGNSGWDSAVKPPPAAVLVGREAQWLCCTFSELPRAELPVVCSQNGILLCQPKEDCPAACKASFWWCAGCLLEALCIALLRQDIDCQSVMW